MKKITDWIFRIIEVYLPTIAFAVMFVSFIIHIFFRYFLNNPLFATDEIITISYLWLVFLGAACIMREGKHISFTLVYEKRSPKGQCIFRIIGNVVMLVFLVCSLPGCLDFMNFLKMDRTVVLRLPLIVYYIPMFISIVLICIHLAGALVKDFKELKGGRLDV